MTSKHDLLLFDFDGTLVDTVGDIAHHANAVLASYNKPACPVERVKGAIGFGVHELLKSLAPALGEDPAVLEEAVEQFKRSYRAEPVRETAPFPGVVEMLSGPLASVRKAIITNKPEDITRVILERLKLGGYFDAVIGMHTGHPPKPDPSSTFFMLRRFGVEPGRCVYIGDSRVDAETSRNAGVDFAWVRYGYDRLDGEERAYEFGSAEEWEVLVSGTSGSAPRTR